MDNLLETLKKNKGKIFVAVFTLLLGTTIFTAGVGIQQIPLDQVKADSENVVCFGPAQPVTEVVESNEVVE